MKKFKSEYIPDATVFDRHTMVCYFETFLVRYGKILNNGKYKLELLLPFKKIIGWACITIYYSKSKPKFHSLPVIGTVWFPFYILLSIIFPIIYLLFIVIGVICGFYYNCLFRKSFITDWVDTLSGYISLLLSIIGLITVIKLFI